ncbi:MAG: hypothetical protein ACYTAN_11075 [Planctomycetota bacterium]
MLVTVKAYPNPSSNYGETVCVAGVTAEEGWVRLYPVTFRDLPDPLRFSKYQWITVELKRNRRDRRPESFRPNLSSLRVGEVIGTRDSWRLRKEILLPTVSESMCEIQRLQQETGQSLGMFRPEEVSDLIVEEAAGEWSTRKKEVLGQGMFWSSPKKTLEKIPFRFLYKYRCSDPKCNGHTQSIIDWEMGQLYRNVRKRHTDKREIGRLIRQKFLSELCGASKETYFFVGNIAKHPATFLVLGVFYPPRKRTKPSNAQSLFH